MKNLSVSSQPDMPEPERWFRIVAPNGEPLTEWHKASGNAIDEAVTNFRPARYKTGGKANKRMRLEQWIDMRDRFGYRIQENELAAL